MIGNKRQSDEQVVNPPKKARPDLHRELLKKAGVSRFGISVFSCLDKTIPLPWRQALERGGAFSKSSWDSLREFLDTEVRMGEEICPPVHQIFRPFRLCPIDKVRVVILCSSPYHRTKRADGLCLSSASGVTPDLKTLYKNMIQTPTEGCEKKRLLSITNGNLQRWAEQGVLMLNVVATVRKGSPKSHFKHGWEEFTHRALRAARRDGSRIVVIAWGQDTHEYCEGFNQLQHLVLKGCDPYEEHVNNLKFEGGKHMNEANRDLMRRGLDPIRWHECLV